MAAGVLPAPPATKLPTQITGTATRGPVRAIRHAVTAPYMRAQRREAPGEEVRVAPRPKGGGPQGDPPATAGGK